MIPAEEDAAGSGTLRGCRFSVRLDPTNFRGLVLGGGGGGRPDYLQKLKVPEAVSKPNFASKYSLESS